jgi:hypothetical protein
MSKQMQIVALGLVAAAPACALDPLVEDEPGASVHVLPAGTEVPYVGDDPELVHQIVVHDGLDDGDLEEAMGIIQPRVGWAGGAEVRYWAWGNAPRTGSTAYVLVDGGGAPVDHPWLLDTMPGDPAYSPLRRLQHVVVTAAYDGEVIATLRALADALELGLIEPPVPTGTWVNAPVVAPGTRLDVGGLAGPASPTQAYAGGVRVDHFVLGGERGVQPLRNGAIPVGQASELLEGSSVRPLAEPVFQYAAPAEPPTDAFNYTPLVNMVTVRLADGVVAEEAIFGDADLFVRSGTGSISATTAAVESFEITEVVRNWPIQFEAGKP